MTEARAAAAADPNEKKIVISHLKKSFGKHEVLTDINLEVANGEVVCIIGPSGSGKSTLLRCINRLETPSGGTVIVDGRDITDKKANINKIRENIGMVFQQFNLFHNHTVLRNITLAPVDRKKYTRQQAAERAVALLERVGLSEKAASYPGELSGGQQQRVAIARALAMIQTTSPLVTSKLMSVSTSWSPKHFFRCDMTIFFSLGSATAALRSSLITTLSPVKPCCGA